MSIHDGHRQRLKQRFLKSGLDDFTQVQVLELLLCYAIPRQDTNELAHRLLEHFGTVSRVLEAPVSELTKISGIGENSAILLRLTQAMSRYYQINRTENIQILSSLEACADYMVPYFHGRTVETVFVLCLDAKCKVLGCKEVGEGTLNAARLNIRKIVEICLSLGASAAVVAHNHPSGIAVPSRADIAATRQLGSALAAIEVVLMDHIVVADDDYVSMAASGVDFREMQLL